MAIRRVLVTLLLVDSLALVWLFGDMLAHGELIPENLAVARYLGAGWGGLAVVWGWMSWRARKNQRSSF